MGDRNGDDHLLCTVPSVGPATAPTIRTLLADGNDFHNGKQVAPIARLSRSNSASGSSCDLAADHQGRPGRAAPGRVPARERRTRNRSEIGTALPGRWTNAATATQSGNRHRCPQARRTSLDHPKAPRRYQIRDPDGRPITLVTAASPSVRRSTYPEVHGHNLPGAATIA